MRKIAELFLLAFAFTIPLQQFAASELVPVAGTVARLVGIAATAVCLTALLQEGRLRKMSRALLLVALYVGYSWLSSIWGVSPRHSLVRATTNMQLLVMVLLLVQFAWNKELVRKMFQAYVIGAWSAVFAQIQAYRSGIMYAQNWIGDTARYTAFENDPNELALTMSLAMPFAWYLVATVKNRESLWNRAMILVNGGYLVGAVFGVLLTSSRGGLIALTLASLALPLSYIYLRASKKALLLTAFFLGGLVVVNFIPETTWNRLATISDAAREARYDSSEANIRVQIWQQGLMTLAGDPKIAVVGVGAGNFAEGVDPFFGERFVAHNTFISVLVELGLIGFILFMSVYIWCWRVVISRMRGLERVVFACGLLCWTAGVSFLTFEQRKETWFLFGSILARETSLPVSREGTFAKNLFRLISGTPPRIEQNRMNPRQRPVRPEALPA